jgi:hypothetical protein
MSLSLITLFEQKNYAAAVNKLFGLIDSVGNSKFVYDEYVALLRLFDETGPLREYLMEADVQTFHPSQIEQDRYAGILYHTLWNSPDVYPEYPDKIKAKNKYKAPDTRIIYKYYMKYWEVFKHYPSILNRFIDAIGDPLKREMLELILRSDDEDVLNHLSKHLQENLNLYVDTYLPIIIQYPDSYPDAVAVATEILEDKETTVSSKNLEKLNYYLAMFEFNSKKIDMDYPLILYHLYHAGTFAGSKELLMLLFNQMWLNTKLGEASDFNTDSDLLLYLLKMSFPG